MTLTLGGGPLATPEPSETNYAIDGPKHRLFVSPFPRRIRALAQGETILDSERAVLVHESNLLPVLYAPLEDFTAELTATDTSTHCPFKGDATYFAAAGVPDLVWAYESPIEAASWLTGLAAPDKAKLDGWLDEDEPVQGLRDPYHRCDVRRRGDDLILSETGLPSRVYVARASVTQALERSETTSHCPYKGDATYFNVDGKADAAWSYEAPYDAVRSIAGHLCFAD